jgi:biotin carboxylase
MNGLMIAFAFSLPYHVMRTAQAAGVRVYALGSGASQALRRSRFCAGYHRSGVSGSGQDDPETLLEEIRQIVRQQDIDVVFPSDDVSTRLLAAIRHRLPVRHSPLPDLATFDLLNDKWNFTRFALDSGVRVPDGRLYETIDELRGAIRCGDWPLPLTLKPVNRSGGQGVMHIRDATELGLLNTVDYQPILVQRHIIGETVGISVICRDGKVVAQATQRRDDRRFELFTNADLLANVERFAAAANLNGPANFDAILEEATRLAYIVECNPRFWFTIYMSMLVGINFMAVALREGLASTTERTTLTDRMLRLSLKRGLLCPWQAGPAGRQFVRYHLGDPAIFAMERLRTCNDSNVAVPVEQMASYEELTAALRKPALVA